MARLRKQAFMEQASIRAMEAMISRGRGRNNDQAKECIRWAEDLWNALQEYELKDNGNDATDRWEQQLHSELCNVLVNDE